MFISFNLYHDLFHLTLLSNEIVIQYMLASMYLLNSISRLRARVSVSEISEFVSKRDLRFIVRFSS